jgi:hypothetical protein
MKTKTSTKEKNREALPKEISFELDTEGQIGIKTFQHTKIIFNKLC